MKIKYEIELEDFFVFSDYLIKTSPLMLKTIRKGQMWWACGPLAGGLVLSILRGYSPEKTLLTLSLLSVAISLPMFLLYKHYFRYRNTKQIKSLYANGTYKSVLGTHEMTISDDCLLERSEDNNNTIQWDSINKIETTSDHTFIFTDEMTAYIIPQKKIVVGDFSKFINKLDTVFKKANP
ncbi:MAG: YcxB family protein [Thermodesulfobacteriota bacterium]|nr:YcxB family protein [Thermodesulfobacteriota bacterium]